MTLRLHNTLSRRVEEFHPLVPGRVTLYTCGPTVWNYAHIGNFRTFLFEDLLRRWLEASGYEVFHIMNLTDVDDRIIAEAGKRGLGIGEFTAPYAEAFFRDRDYLRIRPAHDYPRATGYIEPMVRLVEGLLANGTAYQGEDGSVYFAIGRFPAYGKLSQLDKRQLRAGASERVQADDYAKEDARDFVLWKAAKPEDERARAVWDAPFGRGRPGWHLECSAMALELIRQRYGIDVLDIHAGGVDLIFPHHEDEIAQSCAYTGKPEFARYWLHGEFLNVRGTKMSKRFGNITTARDLQEDGIPAEAIRLLVFQTHYRQKLDLTDEALAAAREGARRLQEFDVKLARAADAPPGAPPGAFDEAAGKFLADFSAELDNDLNAPRAVGALFTFVREGNRLLDSGAAPGAATREAWDKVRAVLDVLPQGTGPVTVSPGVGEVSYTGYAATILLRELIPARDRSAWSRGEAKPDLVPRAGEGMAWAREWALIRRDEKARKNFAEADRIRQMLEEQGFKVRDNKDGSLELVQE